jgi:N utilization substance protein B
MSRRQAREMALKGLYMSEFAPEQSNETILAAAGEDILTEDTKDRQYAELLLAGTKENMETIDKEVSSLSARWEIKRMGALDRNILRMAAFEMFYSQEKVPYSVVINEAVELAKEYGTGESPAFINGVLGSMVKKHGA